MLRRFQWQINGRGPIQQASLDRRTTLHCSFAHPLIIECAKRGHRSINHDNELGNTPIIKSVFIEKMNLGRFGESL